MRHCASRAKNPSVMRSSTSDRSGRSAASAMGDASSALLPTRLRERRDDRLNRFGAVALRRMTAIVEFDAGGTYAKAALNRVELRHRSVFIVAALHHDHRRGDRRKILLDVPVRKRGIEPDVVPAEERSVD